MSAGFCGTVRGLTSTARRRYGSRVGNVGSAAGRASPLVSVVIPVYGNAADLRALHERLGAAVGAAGSIESEFVFVDDGSADESFEVLAALSAEDPRVRVLGLSRNFGSNPAILAGLAQSRGDAVMTLAADLQDPPELLAPLVAAWREGAQVVLAVRRKRDDPLPSRLLAGLFNRLFRALVFPQFPEGRLRPGAPRPARGRHDPGHAREELVPVRAGAVGRIPPRDRRLRPRGTP